MSRTIRVEVVYARPECQSIETVMLPEDGTVGDAVALSGLAARFEDIRVGESPVGIWGRPTEWAGPLREGDRVELYRPLVADPKEIRRKRAKPAR